MTNQELGKAPNGVPTIQDIVPSAAGWLTAAGAIPFGVTAVLGFAPDVMVAAQAIEIMRGYAAVILSFMGGVHWGLTMTEGCSTPLRSWRRYGVSVVPAILGWGALLLPIAESLGLLIAGFALLLAYDIYCSRSNEAPAWYSGLRLPVTLFVLICLGAVSYGL